MLATIYGKVKNVLYDFFAKRQFFPQIFSDYRLVFLYNFSYQKNRLFFMYALIY